MLFSFFFNQFLVDLDLKSIMQNMEKNRNGNWVLNTDTNVSNIFCDIKEQKTQNITVYSIN